jgi:hypothetical protein
MQLFINAVLGLCVLFSALTTLRSGLQPEHFAGQLGLSLDNPGGANEIRAQYAGFFLALAALCAAALFGVVGHRTALIALVVTFGGLLAGRLVSLAINGGFKDFPPTIVALYFIDATGLGLALTALYFDKRLL